MSTESGWSNQKKFGENQHKTIHNLGSNRFGAAVTSKSLYELSAVAIALTNVLEDTDSKGQPVLYLEITSHGARVNDVIRFLDGNLEAYELDVIEVVDANTVVVYSISDDVPAIGDTVKPMRWVTPKTDSDGGLAVSVPTAPAQFVRDGANQQVIEDTVAPANNTPLPVKSLVSPLGKAILSLAAVTEAAYTELMSTVGASSISKVQVFMSSGEPMYLAFGAAAAEVDQIVVIPGGNGVLDMSIPAGTRLSVKKVSAPVSTSGDIIINLFG